MVKKPVKFCKGNLESVAKIVKDYNHAVDHSLPMIEKIMLDTAYQMVNSKIEGDDVMWTETMCFGVRSVFEDNLQNVEFYFCPPHNSFIYLDYNGESADEL